MSREVAKQVVRRTKSDRTFLAALLADAKKALQGYDLTEKEIEFFENADEKTLAGLHDGCFELAERREGKK